MERTNEKEASRQLCERAYRLFDEFRSAYRQEWLRLENNERIYRGDHWYDVPVTDENEPRPVTPIIQSTVENVSADLMDQAPEVYIRPEGAADEHIAKVVEALIRRNHDVSGYTVEYQKLVHDLLVGGYCVQEVGYDPALNNGLGGAFIRHVDDRSILFDPLCDDMQEGRAVFKLSLRTREWIKDRFPLKYPEMGDDPYVASDAPADDILRGDRRNSVLLLEYWWKTPTERDGVFAVHMALIAGGVVLADSREFKPQGYFAHGMYPFVLTPLYMRKGSPLGFGIVDLFEKQQRYADKLDQIVLKNAFMASHNKLLITEASGFDEEDLKDWSKELLPRQLPPGRHRSERHPGPAGGQHQAGSHGHRPALRGLSAGGAHGDRCGAGVQLLLPARHHRGERPGEGGALRQRPAHPVGPQRGGHAHRVSDLDQGRQTGPVFGIRPK